MHMETQTEKIIIQKYTQNGKNETIWSYVCHMSHIYHKWIVARDTSNWI
jgi:hypothetical protein